MLKLKWTGANGNRWRPMNERCGRGGRKAEVIRFSEEVRILAPPPYAFINSLTQSCLISN